MTEPHAALREEVVRSAQRMEAQGMVIGTSGNVSARLPDGDRFLITPNSFPYPRMTADDLVLVDFEGKALSDGQVPSVESAVHLEIYKGRADVQAVIHTHSVYASSLAALRIPIPAFLEELVPYLGGPVGVADYAPSGSPDLGRNAVKALEDRAAILMANHGPVCVGSSLGRAFYVAQLVERAARIYVTARLVGTPHPLPDETVEMHRLYYVHTHTKT